MMAFNLTSCVANPKTEVTAAVSPRLTRPGLSDLSDRDI
jgi:hypothetical protein